MQYQGTDQNEESFFELFDILWHETQWLEAKRYTVKEGDTKD